METEQPLINLKERYELAIKARNFHYDNFNRWMTYFYVIISALFIALYNLIGKGFNESIMWIKIICALGFLFSLLWHWANKGYYYWNINFIMIVNHYEENLLKLKEEERVYAVFANKKVQNNYYNPISGANFSTSKISLLLSYFVTLFWGTGFVLLFNWHWIAAPILSICCITLATWIAKRWLFSKIDHFPDLSLEQIEK